MADTPNTPNKPANKIGTTVKKTAKEIAGLSLPAKIAGGVVIVVTTGIGFITGRTTKKAPKSAKAAAPKSN